MTNSPSHPTDDVWDRLNWIWAVIFYLAVGGPLLLVFLDRQVEAADLRWMALLSVISGGWHWFGGIWLPQRVGQVRERPYFSTFYLSVLVLLWYTLVNLHSAFFFMLFGLYGHLYALLPLPWAIPFSVLLTSLVAYQSGVKLSTNDTLLWVFIIVVITSTLVSLWISAIIAQSASRRLLIEQLEKTRAELAAAERQAGVLQERQRLSHEIHDTLAQGFISIVIHLEAAEQSMDQDVAKTRQHLTAARYTARENIAQARRVVQDLRPEALEIASLPEAITQTVNQWTAECSVLAGVHVTGEIRQLHPTVEVTLLRGLQEALANVRKHAQASQVIVTLSYMSDVVVLDVQDDGIGLWGKTAVSSPTASGGFGLTAMRERVAQLNGTLLIESEPGEGTTLVMELPA